MAKFSMLGAMGAYMDEKAREIVKIDLDDIVDDENNDFEVEGGTEIEKKNALLKDSIEQFGLLDPLTVRPTGDGKYKLISGHRRKLAHARLVAEGKEAFRKVDCIIKEAGDDDAEQMLIEANVPNRTVSDWEKMQAVKRMNDIFKRREEAGEKIDGRRRKHIAAALGMSVSAVGRLENIEKNLGPEYKAELKAGNIGVSVADKIASKPKEEQSKLHEEKGAEVKLADVGKTATMMPKKDTWMPKKDTWTYKIEGIPAEIGELTAKIRREGNTFHAGFWCKLESGEAKTVWDEEHTYAWLDAAYQGAIEMMREDDDASAMLDLREEALRKQRDEHKQRESVKLEGLRLLADMFLKDWRELCIGSASGGEKCGAYQHAANTLKKIADHLDGEIRNMEDVQDVMQKEG